MTTRDIAARLREMYDVEVSPDLISQVTDGAWLPCPWDVRGRGRRTSAAG